MHIYTQNGTKYPSVTTIIHTIAINDTLMKWANYMGKLNKDLKILNQVSTTFGTKVHSHIRKVVDLDAPDPIPARDILKQRDIDQICLNFKNRFKQIHYHTIATEKTIISPELGYAGTLDWLASIEKVYSSDKTVLFDFKTAKAVQSHMFLQLGGYYNLLQSIGQDIDYAAIVLLGVNSCRICPVKLKKIKEFADCFNQLYKFYILWDNLHNTKPDLEIIQELEKQIDN
jgi:hypothetical protein